MGRGSEQGEGRKRASRCRGASVHERRLDHGLRANDAVARLDGDASCVARSRAKGNERIAAAAERRAGRGPCVKGQGDDDDQRERAPRPQRRARCVCEDELSERGTKTEGGEGGGPGGSGQLAAAMGVMRASRRGSEAAAPRQITRAAARHPAWQRGGGRASWRRSHSCSLVPVAVLALRMGVRVSRSNGNELPGFGWTEAEPAEAEPGAAEVSYWPLSFCHGRAERQAAAPPPTVPAAARRRPAAPAAPGAFACCCCLAPAAAAAAAAGVTAKSRHGHVGCAFPCDGARGAGEGRFRAARCGRDARWASPIGLRASGRATTMHRSVLLADGGRMGGAAKRADGKAGGRQSGRGRRREGASGRNRSSNLLHAGFLAAPTRAFPAEPRRRTRTRTRTRTRPRRLLVPSMYTSHRP